MHVLPFPFKLVYSANIITVMVETSNLVFVMQLSFSFCLLPSVFFTYIGQAAYLRKHYMDMPDISNIFFNSIPSM